MRRKAFFIALVLLTLVFVMQWVSRTGPDQYVFLHVVESNNQAISRIPQNEHPLEVSFHSDYQTLWTVQDPPLPGKVLVCFEMDTLGLRLHQELISLDIDEALALSNNLSFSHPQGYEVIDNDKRLIKDDLILRQVSDDGTVVLAWGEQEITLPAGQGWSIGMIGLSTEPISALPDGDWERKLRVAWEKGEMASRLTVFNYGLWPREGLSVGPPS